VLHKVLHFSYRDSKAQIDENSEEAWGLAGDNPSTREPRCIQATVGLTLLRIDADGEGE